MTNTNTRQVVCVVVWDVYALREGLKMGGGARRGGTQKFFYFEEGQKWLENWKNRRIAELNAIQKDDFSSGSFPNASRSHRSMMTWMPSLPRC